MLWKTYCTRIFRLDSMCILRQTAKMASCWLTHIHTHYKSVKSAHRKSNRQMFTLWGQTIGKHKQRFLLLISASRPDIHTHTHTHTHNTNWTTERRSSKHRTSFVMIFANRTVWHSIGLSRDISDTQTNHIFFFFKFKTINHANTSFPSK